MAVSAVRDPPACRHWPRSIAALSQLRHHDGQILHQKLSFLRGDSNDPPPADLQQLQHGVNATAFSAELIVCPTAKRDECAAGHKKEPFLCIWATNPVDNSRHVTVDPENYEVRGRNQRIAKTEYPVSIGISKIDLCKCDSLVVVRRGHQNGLCDEPNPFPQCRLLSILPVVRMYVIGCHGPPVVRNSAVACDKGAPLSHSVPTVVKSSVKLSASGIGGGQMAAQRSSQDVNTITSLSVGGIWAKDN